MKMKKQYFAAAFAGLVLFLLAACASPTAYSGDAKVLYEGNGGATFAGDSSYEESLKEDSSAYQAGDSYTLAANSFSLSGKLFAGWNTAADGSGAAYAVGSTLTLSAASLTLYAQWRSPSALEALKGLNNSVKTKYELANGTRRALEEWSTSWNSTGTEAFDYYAVYSYAASYPGEDRVKTYYAASASTAVADPDLLIAEYVYQRDANGDIVKATERQWDSELQALATTDTWDATYNSQHNYLTYLFYSDDNGNGIADSGEVTENRVCAYAADGINYSSEITLYGAETDVETGLRMRYDPTYLNDDPSTGVIVKELKTLVIRNDESVSDPEADFHSASSYLFSWSEGCEYIYQQAYLDPSGRIQSTIDYSCDSIGGQWLVSSRLDLSQNTPTTYTTYAYSDSGDLLSKSVYDMTLGKQLKSKYLVSYSEEDGYIVSEASSYSYEIETESRGVGSAAGRRPTFFRLPTAHR